MSNTSRQDLALARLTGSAATAFLVAVCCVFPLYIDRFSNLGLIKFSGVFTLLLLFALLLGACAAIGARPQPSRLYSRSGGLLALAAVVLSALLSTCLSLDPVASVWGIGSYYGGMMLILLTAVGYLGIRAFAELKDLDFLFLGIGVTSSLVVVVYVQNGYSGAKVTNAAKYTLQFYLDHLQQEEGKAVQSEYSMAE